MAALIAPLYRSRRVLNGGTNRRAVGLLKKMPILVLSTSPPGTMFLRRRVAFRAGHAYWFADKSEAENRTLFGRWASPWGHGHNYVVEVWVAGDVDPSTGMVVNLVDVDRVLKGVVGPLSDRHLTYEVPHFRDHPPTLENIARFLAREFEGAYSGYPGHLARLSLWESPTLGVEWLGTEVDEMLFTRRLDFAAAHRLHAPGLGDAENEAIFGKCNTPHGHGHNYGVEVTIAGAPDPTTGMLVDLSAFDAVLDREIMDHFDHKHLNYDVEEFRSVNPTSENVTLAIWRRLEGAIPAPARLFRVVVEETDRNRFEYYGGETA
ncbi:MAG: 6-carboxytetrahydropterin synthase [Armatimonadota bacterium]